MKIDNYSKAIGIIYATSRMMHPLDEGLDSVALKMYNEALGLLEHAEEPKTQTISTPFARPDGKNIDTHPPSETYPNFSFELCSIQSSPEDYKGITTTMAAEPETEQVPTVEESSAAQEPEHKPPVANVWMLGEDSFIRASASSGDAVRNKPADTTRTDSQIRSRWYYLKQRRQLLSKGDRVWYQGDNENLCQKFTPAGRGAILGSISAITDDKTSATVFFDGDKSAYQIPICDIIRAGEA